MIVHTGLGATFAVHPPALRHPRVRIILAHAVWGVYSAEAVVAPKVCPNVYLEPSWRPTYAVRQMIARFGADRVLFGSDHLDNLPVELVKYRSLGLEDDQLARVLGGTARKFFGLET